MLVVVVGTALPGVMFDLGALVVLAGILCAVAIVASGFGHRVVIDVDGVHLRKHWFGVPYRQQRIPHDQQPRASSWLTFDGPEPEGVVLISKAVGGTEDRMMFGTKKRTSAIIAAVNGEIAAVQSTLDEPDRYR